MPVQPFTGPWPGPGTLAAAADEYLATVRHLASWKSRRSEVRAWVAALGARPVAGLTKLDVLRVRSTWLAGGCAPKTVNNRVATLQHLCGTLDLPDPAARIRPVQVPRTLPQIVPVGVIEQVLERLADAGLWRTRARFGVLAATGRRPSEVMRTRRGDLDWERAVWRVRDGKGGWTPGGVALAATALAAWREFDRVEAWGCWDQTSWVRTLRRHGWPEGLRPYCLRHSVGIAMSEAGIDLSDVGAALGHRSTDMTRSHYVPVSDRRMRKAAEALEGARPIPALAADGPPAQQLALPLGTLPFRRPTRRASVGGAEARVVRPARTWGARR